MLLELTTKKENTEPAPWLSEHRLDAEIVRTVLAAQFPEIRADAVEYLHEGWDSWAFVVNEEWVLRFPKRREVQVWLEAELRVLDVLRRQRLGLRIPEPVFVGEPGPLFPCRFAGYRMLSGTLGDQFDALRVRQDESARRLGELLSVVHSIEPGVVAALKVRDYPDSLQRLREEAAALRETILARLPTELHPVCRPFLERQIDVPVLDASRDCLVHGDLGAEHVLLDADGIVTGVIDWGDVCRGDPALDFVGIGAWLGIGFVRKVLAQYSLPWDEAFVKRITFGKRCVTLVNLGWALKGGGANVDEQIRSVETAFGL